MGYKRSTLKHRRWVRGAREIGKNKFLKKEILLFFAPLFFPVLEIVVSIFWMEAGVSVESGID
jgi:hypothetical protein